MLHSLSVQFSRSVVSDSLRPHEQQHARPPCPSPFPRVHPDSCLSSRWCYPAISSSVVPFSSWPQDLPASKSFPMSQLFTWGGQSTGVSALASFLPKNTQDWSRHWHLEVLSQLPANLMTAHWRRLHIHSFWSASQSSTLQDTRHLKKAPNMATKH